MEASQVGRKAPYAPVSALREFLDRIPNIAVPGRVDKRFLEKLSIASNNEWALLSALKFLGIIDPEGVPTSAYRRLQTTDRRPETLRHLVETSYAPLLELGGMTMDAEELRNYFRVSSSPSQAGNAARFFRELCEMSGYQGHQSGPSHASSPRQRLRGNDRSELSLVPGTGNQAGQPLVEAKARLLEKLPACRDEWSAADYERICAAFLEMLRNLDRSAES